MKTNLQCIQFARYSILLATLFVIVVLAGCQKTGGALNNNNEQTLVIETMPVANGHVEAPAPGPDFPLVITVRSTMPASGVKIDVTAKPDGGVVPFFTYSTVSTNPVNNITITGATSGIVALVEITVSSVSNSANKFTGSYKFSRK